MRLVASGIALLALLTGGVPGDAAAQKAASTPNSAARPAQESFRPDGRLAVSNVRTGIHPSHTRVVLDLTGPAEWSVQRADQGTLVILVRNALLGEGIRPVVAAQGFLRRIQPKQVPDGVEVRLATAQPRPAYRTLTLENPDRLVVDLVSGESAPREDSGIAKSSSGSAHQEHLRPSRTPAAPVPAPQPAPAVTQAESPAPRPTSIAPPAPEPSLPLAPPASGAPVRPVPSAAPGEAPPQRASQPVPPPTAAVAPPVERDGPMEEPRIASVPAGPPPPADERSAVLQVSEGEKARGALPPRAEERGPAALARDSRLTVVIDPGHGGHDTGAIGPSGLMEKDVVLDLALRLKRLLEERLQVRVLMTRSEDVFVSLAERTAIANRAKADFFISLHVNAAEKRGAIGFETFFFAREPSDSDARASAQRENLVLDTNGAAGADRASLLKMTLTDMAVTRDMKESSTLAELVLASLDKSLKVENRGVKSGPFYVLATAAMPAILVESAFITNPREERRLQQEDHRQRVAEALYDGIARYKTRYEQRLGMRPGPAAHAGS